MIKTTTYQNKNGQSPFKFLDAYQKGEEAIFFGREPEKEIVSNAFRKSSFVAVSYTHLTLPTTPYV